MCFSDPLRKRNPKEKKSIHLRYNRSRRAQSSSWVDDDGPICAHYWVDCLRIQVWHVRNDDETAALAGCCWPYGSDTKEGIVIVDRMKTNKRQNPAVVLQPVVSGANNSGPFLPT